MEHFNQLSLAEVERLGILSEELGESQQIIGKILRHGYASYDPTAPVETRMDNRNLLEMELGHVACAIDKMIGKRDLVETRILAASIEKEERPNKYLHHQEEERTVEIETA